VRDSFDFNDPAAIAEGQRAFVGKVFLWMAISLVITGVTSIATMGSPALLDLIFGSNIVFFGLIIAEFVLVYRLSAKLHTMSAQTATLSMVVYSVLNGLTLSVVFLAYTASSVGFVFFVAAGMFGSAYMVGQTTKRDLSSLGGVLVMALIGLILATIANLFFHSSQMEMMICYIGVLIFAGLTAYDAQKIKALGQAGFNNPDDMHKMVIMGALALYLDFINIFLFLLRILGRRR